MIENIEDYFFRDGSYPPRIVGVDHAEIVLDGFTLNRIIYARHRGKHAKRRITPYEWECLRSQDEFIVARAMRAVFAGLQQWASRIEDVERGWY